MLFMLASEPRPPMCPKVTSWQLPAAEGEDEGIGARVADQLIGASPAFREIVACSTVESITVRSTGEQIIAAVAEQLLAPVKVMTSSIVRQFNSGLIRKKVKY